MSDDRAKEVREQAILNAQDEIKSQYEDAVDHLLGLCESPIEELFLLAIGETLVRDPWYAVSPQMQIGQYRVDFVVRYLAGKWGDVDVVVECDGHDFHEKTREQAERDKKRDRAITAEGYTVMRFSGRELYRDPFACVEEVIDYTQDVIYQRGLAEYRRRQEQERIADVTEPEGGA